MIARIGIEGMRLELDALEFAAAQTFYRPGLKNPRPA
jgi:hypothetical protein